MKMRWADFGDEEKNLQCQCGNILFVVEISEDGEISAKCPICKESANVKYII
jgi:phage FluMu protein Com